MFYFSLLRRDEFSLVTCSGELMWNSPLNICSGYLLPRGQPSDESLLFPCVRDQLFFVNVYFPKGSESKDNLGREPVAKHVF